MTEHTKGGDAQQSYYQKALEDNLKNKKLVIERLIKECQEKNHIPAN